MAVLSHSLHWYGAVGDWDAYGRRLYAAVYRVKTDNNLDNVKTVIDYLEYNNIVKRGDTYSYGNDSDTLALCTMISPRRPAGTARTWEVTASYETPDERTPAGTLSLNPVDWRHELSTANRGVAEAATSLKYLQAICLRPEGTYGPAMNQAGQIFDPPPERERWNHILRIEKYDTYFPNDEVDYIGHVNQEPIFVNYSYWNYARQWLKYEAKCIAWHGVAMRLNGYDVWRWTLEFEVDRLTWKFKTPNIGTYARALGGDRDENGEAYSEGGTNPNKPPETGLRRLKDATGQPLTQPVPLDANGKPKAAGAEVDYLEFLKDPEANYNNLRNIYGLFGPEPEE